MPRELERALQARDQIEKGAEQNRLDDVRALMETLGVSAERAMELLKVPEERQSEILAML